jgi:hypothetical protein
MRKLNQGQRDNLSRYIAYLNDTLIPDLRESRQHGTAEDMETAITWLRLMLPLPARRAVDREVASFPTHTKDADCTTINDDCTGCGVHHGPPCWVCDGRAFHVAGCAYYRKVAP